MKIKSTYFFMATAIIALFSLCKPKQTVVNTPKPVVEKKDSATTEIKQPVKPEQPVQIELSINFFMPFHFQENLEPPADDLQEQELLANSLPSIQFYEGARMAIDSMKKENLKINIKVFDAGDSSKLETLVKGINIYKSDLLFAGTPPIYISSLIRGAKINNNTIVYSLAVNVKDQHLVSVLPNNQTMITEMADYIRRHFQNHKILVVYRDIKKEKELGEWFAAKIDSTVTKESVSPLKSVNVNYSTEKAEGLFKKLDKSKNNLVIIASSDEAFISPLINQLVEKTEEIKIQVCGLPTWENFETTNIQNLEKLNTIIFTSNFINYDDPELKNFRKEFINKYSADPLLQAYQGFYMMKGFLQSVTEENKNWKDLSKNKEFFNSSLFNFAKDSTGGFENKYISVLKFSDYKLQLQPY